jgi:hypothetical protein
MKNTRALDLKIQSIRTDDNSVIEQQSIHISLHDVSLQYLLLAKNNFNDGLMCPGYFNRRTNFIIGEKNSILVMDNNATILKDEHSNTSNIMNDHYLIYPIPALNMTQNPYLVINDKKIILDDSLGTLIGQVVGGELKVDDIDIDEQFKQELFNTSKGISLNKNILINTNYTFIIGILKGYLSTLQDKCIIKPFVNIYTITTMLNYLGAFYSIRNHTYGKELYFKLPMYFRNFLPKKYITNQMYAIVENKVKLVKDTIISFESESDLVDRINIGNTLLIPTNSINFEQADDNILYDLTCEHSGATNYSLPFTPFMKNSDGDILGATGIFTKGALQDAQQFSPENKEYYKDLNTATINNWISDDAILGLYNATNIK